MNHRSITVVMHRVYDGVDWTVVAAPLGSIEMSHTYTGTSPDMPSALRDIEAHLPDWSNK